MRRLLITLLCALIVAPAAVAATRAAGDGVLELKSVDGSVGVGTIANPARGALWGQMDRGTLSVIDPVAGDGQILVSGWDSKKSVDLPSGYTKLVYSGKDLHFRVTGGKYKLTFGGFGIDFTAVGVGVAYLNGDDTVDDAGYYAVNGGKWIPVPTFFIPPQQSKQVPFGDQSATSNP